VTPTPINPALVPPGVGGPAPVAAPTAPQRQDGPVDPTRPTFADTLAQRAQGVTFSNHALQRVQRRGIDVDPTTLQRLDAGVARAAAKGAKESVVLVDQTAFVVSVANRTVITAVGRDQMRDQVFTNIDSAVIA
jgi:flagellar operon protein